MNNKRLDICECDVEDKQNLALFRIKILEWQNILSGDDVHSIYNQVQDLIWDDTVYRTFNKATDGIV